MSVQDGLLAVRCAVCDRNEIDLEVAWWPYVACFNCGKYVCNVCALHYPINLFVCNRCCIDSYNEK
jgi:hypothetical protein